jgi:adenine/guanine phosphoribosyltransferase-like PRPP-binding protein
MSSETARLVDRWILTFLETPALNDPELLKQLLDEHAEILAEDLDGPTDEAPVHRTRK